jgi:hypothetical protein
MDLIISSGYPSPFRTVAEELKAAQADPSEWYPMTPDFRATAVHSGGADEAASFDQLLKIIENKKPGSIVELGLVGHASPTAFALAGTETTRNIRFDPKGLIHPDTIHDKLARITALRDRFKTGDKDNPPSITLFACDAGSGDDLLEAISSAFQVTARGFQHEIWWCFMVIKRAAVRGRTWYDGVGMGVHPQCDSDRFSVDIRTWKPDKQKVAKS